MKFRLLFAIIISVVALSAFAQAGPGTVYYDDYPRDPCGPVDANTPCYASSSGGGKCPENTSYENCRKRCDCMYASNIKKCQDNGGGLVCYEVATSERNACYGNCITDWSMGGWFVY